MMNFTFNSTSELFKKFRFVSFLFIKISLLAILYFSTGKLGLMLAVPPGYATIIWPPSGIAIGALLLFGLPLWPGIFIGSLLLNSGMGAEEFDLAAISFDKIMAAAAIAGGSVLQAFVAYSVVTRFSKTPIDLKNWRDTLRLFMIAGPVACVVAATIGVATLYFSGTVQAEDLLKNWTTWWAGDTLGVLVFLPLMIVGLGKAGRLLWHGQSIGALPSVALVVLMLPLGVTLYAWKVTTEHNFERSKSSFAVLAEENETALLNRLASYEQGLRGGMGFFSGTPELTHEKWAAYVEALDLETRFPGINGIGFIADWDRRYLESLVEHERRTGAPEFTIHPVMPEKEQFIINYIEPIAVNRAARGLNIAFEESRYNAATLARSSGLPTITRRILLVQDATKSPGFLLLQAMYKKGMPVDTPAQRRAAFNGWVYAPFVGRSFMSDLTKSQGTTLHLRVYDGATNAEDALIFSSAPVALRASMTPKFTVRHERTIMQQPWTLVWTSTPEFEKAATSNEPELILGGGLVFTVLFGTLLMFFAQRAETVRRLVATKTQEIAASEETFRLSMEYASIGMGVVGLDGRWSQLNPSLCELLGYDESALLGQTFDAVLHPEDLEAGREHFNQILSGESGAYQTEKRYLHKSGRTIWALLNVSLARHADGQPRNFIFQIQDITDRKQMDRVKGEFISTVSHELRTPLTAIRGSIGIIIGAMTKDLPPQANHLLQIAHNNCERLIHLINDILDIEKIASGNMRYELKSEDLAPLVEQSIEANLAYAERFNVSFVAKSLTPVIVNIDAARMMQVLANLLSNAAKFSPPDSEVEIRLETIDGRARLSVRDFGSGIPSDFHSLIFSRFSQADSSATRAKGGTGLGLHITKQIVDEMGGTIDFATEVGRGTVFRVEFPDASVVVEDQPAATIAAAIGMDGKPLPRILHVEDDADLSKFLAVALHDKAFIVQAGSLQEARELLKRNSYSLIILDQGLPDGSGLSLLDDVENLLDDIRPPVVILSADDVSDATRQRVITALVKSRIPESQIVDAILKLAS